MFSIEMTLSSINIVNGKQTGSQIRVKEAFSIPMPPRAIRNGYIKDVNVVAVAVRDALLERNIRKGKAVITLNSMAIKTKDIQVHEASRSRMLEIMEKSIGDIIANEEHVIDYHVIGTTKENKTTLLHCTMLACPVDLVKSYVMVAKESRLSIDRLDLHNNAILKLWEKKDPKIKRVIAQETRLKVKKQSKKAPVAQVEVTERVTPPPVQEINQVLQLWVGLYYDEVKLHTNALNGNFFSKTVMLSNPDKIALPINNNDQNDGEENPAIDEEKQLILQYVGEIQNFVEFQKTVYTTSGIQEIYLYGEYENIGKLAEIAEALIGIRVTLMPVPKFVKGIQPNQYPKYCCAIGSLLRR